MGLAIGSQFTYDDSCQCNRPDRFSVSSPVFGGLVCAMIIDL